ncbi:unnamed protein product, partial [marine sediment metagenome]
ASAGQARSQFLQSMQTLLSITAYFGTAWGNGIYIAPLSPIPL